MRIFAKAGADVMSRTGSCIEIKADALTETGEFEGYASTFGGEPDSYGDVIAPGAYAESLAEHKLAGTMPKMFWQHDSSKPIGRWTEAVEDGKGLFMRGRLNMEVQQAREAHSHLKNGDIDGLSIGYRIKNYEVDTETGVWTLTNIILKEVSIVSIAANENASVTNVKAAKQVHGLIEKLKAGDRLTERELETLLKGAWDFSNSQAERAARVLLKGQRDSADADSLAFLRALRA